MSLIIERLQIAEMIKKKGQQYGLKQQVKVALRYQLLKASYQGKAKISDESFGKSELSVIAIYGYVLTTQNKTFKFALA